jgi:hypothetical protein
MNSLYTAFVTAMSAAVLQARLSFGVVGSFVAGFVAVAAVGWMLVALAPMPEGSRWGLALKTMAPLSPTEETEDADESAGSWAGGRVEAHKVLVEAIGTEADEQTSAGSAEPAMALAPLNSPASAVTGAGQPVARPTIEERTAEEMRAAPQRTAEPAPVETRKQLATAWPEAGVRGAKRPTERDSKARGSSTGSERAQTSVAQPAGRAVQPLPKQTADQQIWDCRPSPPSGLIVCHPLAKRPASAKVPSAARPRRSGGERTQGLAPE